MVEVNIYHIVITVSLTHCAPNQQGRRDRGNVADPDPNILPLLDPNTIECHTAISGFLSTS